jgi:abortive infection bacteriophage resistance protein
MTFGTMLTFFRGIRNDLKRKIASEYNIPFTVFESWLTALQAIRNIAAHHSRLWNRELGYKPMIPRLKKHPEWHYPAEIKNNRLFGILSVIKYLLDQIDTENIGKKWKKELVELLRVNPDIPIDIMGFPINWQDSPIWGGNY